MATHQSNNGVFSQFHRSHPSLTVVVIDSSVQNHQLLAAGVVEGAQIIILNPDQDGIEQITVALGSYPNVTNLHIVSHGSPGCLYLGNTQLSLATLERYAWDLQAWFAQTPAFQPNLLLYGCSVAAGETGIEFLQQLHHLTGANLAATTTPTGSAALGGNWELEVTIGTAERSLAFQPMVMESYTATFSGTAITG